VYMNKKRVVGVIPARFKSYRFPGKVIQPILGKPMIWHVYNQCKKASLLDEIIVATEDVRVAKLCESLSIPVMMSSDKHESGTERVLEVSGKIDGQVFINIQGDEPLIQGEMIDLVAKSFLEEDFHGVVTLKKYVSHDEEILSPHVVKVVTDSENMALYFSRSVIPYSKTLSEGSYYKHIGLYGYVREVLERMPDLPRTNMEKSENLEQLRLLNSGVKIKVLETPYETIGVDVPEDILKVENYLKAMPPSGHQDVRAMGI
ncbi:MAG: 3-deoxy-manno-octulosonate cytidylyltransferase, partial [Spirochaetota bacterium]|nr:3-deoxy-manno-octulosonate cytidylyltransferase [Spirochaetota bacterium]